MLYIPCTDQFSQWGIAVQYMGTSSYVGDIFQQYFTYLPGMLTLVYFTYMYEL